MGEVKDEIGGKYERCRGKIGVNDSVGAKLKGWWKMNRWSSKFCRDILCIEVETF